LSLHYIGALIFAADFLQRQSAVHHPWSYNNWIALFVELYTRFNYTSMPPAKCNSLSQE